MTEPSVAAASEPGHEFQLRLGEESCDVSVLFNSLGFLTRATHLLERDFIRNRQDCSLPFGTYSALAMIDANPGIRQGLLGAILQVQESNMAILTKRLIADNSVERRPLGKGRRGMGLWLTAKGKGLVTQMRPMMKDIDSRFAAALSSEEQGILTTLLGRVLRFRLQDS